MKILSALLRRPRGGQALVPPIRRLGRLAFREGALRRADGVAVTLRGVSLFWSQWMPQFYNRPLVHWLAQDWQIDVIRVPVAALDPGYLSDPAGELAQATAVVDAAIEAGIFVILDWHAHEPHTTHALTLFDSVARRYGDCVNLLYESWNEPSGDYSWSTDIVPHHMAVLETIRSHAPGAPVILGSPELCRNVDIAAKAPLGVDNVAYAFHFYAASHRAGLRARVREALDAGACVFASEWGLGDASGDGPADPDEARRWLEFLNEKRIGHINWSICDKAETCAALRPGAASQGGWSRRDLSESGRFVRDYLRTSHAAAARRSSGGEHHSA